MALVSQPHWYTDPVTPDLPSPRLPQELLDAIITAAALVDGSPDMLGAFSCASKRFLPTAQKHLFRSLTVILPTKSLSTFSEFLDEASSYVLPAVTEVTIEARSFHDEAGKRDPVTVSLLDLRSLKPRET